MSSKNRGSEVLDLESYFTPLPVARATIKRLLDDGLVRPGGNFLEPSVGRGAWVKAAEEFLNPDAIDVVDVRIDPELRELDISNEFEMDFLSFGASHTSQGYGLIAGNPAFSLAEAHIRHARQFLAPDGILAMLLRTAFKEGGDRYENGFWLNHPHVVEYQLVTRPSFRTVVKPKIDKKTGQVVLSKKTGKPLMVTTNNDSSAYSIFCWSAKPSEYEPVARWLDWRPFAEPKVKKTKAAQIAVPVPVAPAGMEVVRFCVLCPTPIDIGQQDQLCAACRAEAEARDYVEPEVRP